MIQKFGTHLIYRCSVNVTFFNELGDCFLNALAKEKETPVIVILASAKINEWKGITLSKCIMFWSMNELNHIIFCV